MQHEDAESSVEHAKTRSAAPSIYKGEVRQKASFFFSSPHRSSGLSKMFIRSENFPTILTPVSINILDLL